MASSSGVARRAVFAWVRSPPRRRRPPPRESSDDRERRCAEGYLDGFRSRSASCSKAADPRLLQANDAMAGQGDKPVACTAGTPQPLRGRMEKCIGCELCAGVCPPVSLRARRRQPARRPGVAPSATATSTRSYLRCIHCDLCVRPVRRGHHRVQAVEFSFTDRQTPSTQGRAGGRRRRSPRQLPWRLVRHRGRRRQHLAWIRATAPSVPAAYEGLVQWPRLGFGVRAPELGQTASRIRPPTARPPAQHRDRRPRGGSPCPGRARRLVMRRRLLAASWAWCSREPVPPRCRWWARCVGIAVLFVAQEANFLAAVQSSCTPAPSWADPLRVMLLVWTR